MSGKRAKGSKNKRARINARNPRGNKRGGRKYKKVKPYQIAHAKTMEGHSKRFMK